MVYKGLETVRSDWSPLAQQFQRELYERIFLNQPYQGYIRDYVERTLNGELDELLVYTSKRLRRTLTDYGRNVPPRARRATGRRIQRRPRPTNIAAIPARRLDQLRDHHRRPHIVPAGLFNHWKRAAPHIRGIVITKQHTT